MLNTRGIQYPDDYPLAIQRLQQALVMLRETRVALLDKWKRDNQKFQDEFVVKESGGTGGEDVLHLPFIYGLETLLMPIGLITAECAKRKRLVESLDVLVPALKDFRVDDIDENTINDINGLVKQFDREIGPAVRAVDYEGLNAQPYFNKWNDDANAWATALFFDATDYLNSAGLINPEQYIERVNNLSMLLKKFLFAKYVVEWKSDLDENVQLFGLTWYFSDESRRRISRYFQKSGSDFDGPVVQAFIEDYFVCETRAFCSRAVLAVYDVIYDTFGDSDIATDEIKKLVGRIGARFAKDLAHRYLQDMDNSIERAYFDDLYRTDYLVQLWGVYTSCLHTGIIAESQGGEVEIDLLVRYHDEFLKPLLKTIRREIRDDHSPLFTTVKPFLIWLDEPAEIEPADVHPEETVEKLGEDRCLVFPYVSLLPIMLRSLANYAGALKDIKDPGGKQNVRRMRNEALDWMHEVLEGMTQFAISDGDEAGLWAFSGQYELAYTASIAEALTTYASQCFNEVVDLGRTRIVDLAEPLRKAGSAAGAVVSEADSEAVRAFKEFRKVLDLQVRRIVAEELDGRDLQGRSGGSSQWMEIFFDIIENKGNMAPHSNDALQAMRDLIRLSKRLDRLRGRGEPEWEQLRDKIKSGYFNNEIAYDVLTREYHGDIDDLLKNKTDKTK